MIDLLLGLLEDLLHAFFNIWPEGRIARIVAITLHLLAASLVAFIVGAIVARMADDRVAFYSALFSGAGYVALVGWLIFRRATRG